MKLSTITRENRYFHEIMLLYKNWWGEEFNLSLKEIKEKYKETLKTDSFPIIRALIQNDTLIGMYEINKNDNLTNIEYEPFLANVYIKEEYRKQKYSKYLIEDAINYIKKRNIQKLYLHTRLKKFYESYGFTFLKEVNSPYGKKRIYVYDINSTK